MDAIATLAGGIAHQFNNALQGIIGNLDLLAMRFSEDEFMGPRLASMKETSRRMSRLTAQLLARITSYNVCYTKLLRSRTRSLRLTGFMA